MEKITPRMKAFLEWMFTNEPVSMFPSEWSIMWKKARTMTPTERLNALAEILRPLVEAREKATKGTWKKAAGRSSVVGWPIVSNTRPIADLQCIPKGHPVAEGFHVESSHNGDSIATAANLDYAAIKRILEG